MGEPDTTKITNWSYWVQEEYPTTVDNNNNFVSVKVNQTAKILDILTKLNSTSDLQTNQVKEMVKTNARGGGGDQLIQRRPRRKGKTQTK